MLCIPMFTGVCVPARVRVLWEKLECLPCFTRLSNQTLANSQTLSLSVMLIFPPRDIQWL